jgi:hypothetical protein
MVSPPPDADTPDGVTTQFNDWRRQVLARLAEFQAAYERCARTIDVARAEQVKAALVEVMEELRGRHPDRAAVREKVERLAAVAANVGSLVTAAEGLRSIRYG